MFTHADTRAQNSIIYFSFALVSRRLSNASNHELDGCASTRFVYITLPTSFKDVRGCIAYRLYVCKCFTRDRYILLDSILLHSGRSVRERRRNRAITVDKKKNTQYYIHAISSNTRLMITEIREWQPIIIAKPNPDALQHIILCERKSNF